MPARGATVVRVEESTPSLAVRIGLQAACSRYAVTPQDFARFVRSGALKQTFGARSPTIFFDDTEVAALLAPPIPRDEALRRLYLTPDPAVDAGGTRRWISLAKALPAARKFFPHITLRELRNLAVRQQLPSVAIARNAARRSFRVQTGPLLRDLAHVYGVDRELSSLINAFIS